MHYYHILNVVTFTMRSINACQAPNAVLVQLAIGSYSTSFYPMTTLAPPFRVVPLPTSLPYA